MRKPISYFGKSWREIQALRAERKREIFWEGVEKRFEENRRIWREECAYSEICAYLVNATKERTDEICKALDKKTMSMVEIRDKLVKQVASKLD